LCDKTYIMPPKKDKVTISDQSEESVMDMLRSMSAQLNSMNTRMMNFDEKIEKIDHIDSEVRSLKVLLQDLKSENVQLKRKAKENDHKLSEMNERNNLLENRINSLEQHHRSWSARVLNIPLTQEEESNNCAVASKVYDLVLLPILRGAVERKLLPEVPRVEQLLEMAHILPGKAGEPKPVIIRFYNRNVKEIVFKTKKYYAPRAEGGRGGGRRPSGDGGDRSGGGGGRSSSGDLAEEAGGFEGRGRYSFPLYEDLTRATFKKMRALADDDRVKACWSVKGQLRFVLHRSPNDVKKVVSLMDTLDTILG
jgi:hypothetical protein